MPVGQEVPVKVLDTVLLGQKLPTGQDPQVSSLTAENCPVGQAVAVEVVHE